ncbi:hypothetical protein GJAV_G00184440 [Gymnothorax javanicus]|nr:hypothetical protein GJAV_G00184440 [Gymnothorax javanicus]
MALESFNELLHRLKDLHEREIEGWQEKVLELTNQKCCDSKRMEELFNKNQLLREQQRLLTENIKQLENRLRAGLCDRCTVTQDVAKRRQQEYENSQIQSLQHITVLVSEMNALKKENKRLQDEVKNLRGVLDGQNSLDSLVPATEVRQSPDPSLSATSLIATSIQASKQPQCVATLSPTLVKSDPDQNICITEEKLPGYRRQQSWNGHESQMAHKLHIPTPLSPGQRAEKHTVRGPIVGEKRVRSVEAMEPQLSPSSAPLPSPSPLLFLKNLPYTSSAPSSSPMAEEKPVRNILHAPVPYRPRPIKTARLSMPWPLPEQSDWAALGPLCSIGIGPPQAPSLTENNRGVLRGKDLNHNGKRNMGLYRADRPAPQLHTAAPPVKMAVSAEQVERKDKTVERGVGPAWWRSGTRQPERIFGENLRDSEPDAPLDLSGPGKSKSCGHQLSHETSPVLLERDIKEEAQSCDRIDTPPQTSAGSSSSSSSPLAHSSPSSACSTRSPPQEQGQHTQLLDTQDQDEPLEGKQDLNSEISANTEEKKIPALTISLHPVVVLEALKPGLEKKDSGDGEMELELPSENKLEEQSEDSQSSFEMSHNGKRRTRGQIAGREALRPRSPKERRVKLSPGWQVRTHSVMEQS